MDTCKIKHAESAQKSAPMQVSNLLESDGLDKRSEIEGEMEEADPVESPIVTESFENLDDFDIVEQN